MEEESGVHYRLFSVWTLVPVGLDQQLSDHSTVDEIASGSGLSLYLHNGELSSKAVKRRQWAGGGSAVGVCVGHLLVCEETGLENREKGKRKREREKEEKELGKRQGLVILGSGENPIVLLGDADQESETRMSKNALRTGRRQAVE
ncbi:hypothetical protein TNCV_774891 [Trichonephila clavipes]|nr:hypothetical protein TNCV_774891 [Trichonephila clavipes]